MNTSYHEHNDPIAGAVLYQLSARVLFQPFFVADLILIKGGDVHLDPLVCGGFNMLRV